MYELDSPVDADVVQLGYLLLFGRRVENAEAIDAALVKPRTLSEFRSDMASSPEYAGNLRDGVRDRMIEQYLACQAERVDQEIELTPTSSNILFQTADANRYANMLNVSSFYNRQFARTNRMNYFQYVGVRKGRYPHHAALNRIFILLDLVDQSFNGWVVYIDADAVFSQPSYDLSGHLEQLRTSGKRMVLHSVYPPGHEHHQWWDINSGCFAVDLSSRKVRALIRAWAGVYENLYTSSDFEAANMWHGWIVDDQHTLWPALRQFDMRSLVSLENLQDEGGIAKQFLRSDSHGISSEDEINHRVEAIRTFGDAAYPRHYA